MGHCNLVKTVPLALASQASAFVICNKHCSHIHQYGRLFKPALGLTTLTLAEGLLHFLKC